MSNAVNRSKGDSTGKPYARLATREDAIELAKNLRKEDLGEIAHGSGLPPETALRYALAISNIAYAVMKEDRVVALFGIAEDLHWDNQVGTGHPWMLASPELTSIRKSFLRECRGYVQGWLDHHKALEGFVWSKNEVHIQWLKWLGFQFDEPAPYGITNELFMRFHMKEEDV